MTPCGAEKFSGSGRWRSHRNPQINISQHISQNNSNHDISKSDMFELNLLKVNIYIFIFIHIYILCNIMYIYIERERKKTSHKRSIQDWMDPNSRSLAQKNGPCCFSSKKSPMIWPWINRKPHDCRGMSIMGFWSWRYNLTVYVLMNSSNNKINKNHIKPPFSSTTTATICNNCQSLMVYYWVYHSKTKIDNLHLNWITIHWPESKWFSDDSRIAHPQRMGSAVCGWTFTIN